MSAPKPELNGVVSFVVGKLRELNLQVNHTPNDDNQAHTDVSGKTVKIQHDVEIRTLLSGMIKWEISI